MGSKLKAVLIFCLITRIVLAPPEDEITKRPFWKRCFDALATVGRFKTEKPADLGNETIRGTEPKLAPPELTFGNAKADLLMRQSGWNGETVFYRFMRKEHLIQSADGTFVVANPDSQALHIVDIYADRRREVPAVQLGPSLNVSTSQNFYRVISLEPGMIAVEMKLKDLITAGALPYPDAGTSLANSYLFTVPSGIKVPVKVFRDEGSQPVSLDDILKEGNPH